MTAFLEMILREIARRAALVAAGVLAVVVLALALMHEPALPLPPADPGPAPMRTMDHPRCFPPDAHGAWAMCPDSLPEMRAA